MPTQQLSPHFTLSEFVVSQTAAREGIDNTPTPEVLENLKKTALLMETVRSFLGNHPIFVSSGYRSPALNEAIGGARNSAHMFGCAADFTCPAFGTVEEVCLAIDGSDMQFDQLIREFDIPGPGWCHIAWSPQPRRMALTIDNTGTRFGIMAS